MAKFFTLLLLLYHTSANVFEFEAVSVLTCADSASLSPHAQNNMDTTVKMHNKIFFFTLSFPPHSLVLSIALMSSISENKQLNTFTFPS